MKKCLVILLAVCFLLSAFALADEGGYGSAVVYGGNATKVHLRTAPSTRADSMGLYFTGTKVKCRSGVENGWVKVKIGVEDGYMSASYLRYGASADQVRPAWMTGTVNAPNWANLRRGPSTEYQLLDTIRSGQTVSIMGETVDHWYYVDYYGTKGYISANLVDVVSTPQPYPDVQPESWKTAYRRYVMDHAYEAQQYDLIHVDGDGIPELVIDSGSEAGGCEILAYSGGTISKLQTRRRDFTYLPGTGLLCNSSGNMDSYYDDVYLIQNGRWVQIASGEYSGYTGRMDSEFGRWICTNYMWNGRWVSREEYMRSLTSLYNLRSAISPSADMNLDEILGILW